MNVSNSSAATPSNSPSAPSAAERRAAPPRSEQRSTRDAFERALHAKAQPCDSDETDSTGLQPPPCEGAPPMMVWACAPLSRAPELVAAPAAADADPATGTRAVIETALHNPEPQALHPLAAPERTTVWEASVGDRGGTVDVRAERTIANGTPPSWRLTIDAPVLGADLAARHAPKLHDRLRKQGIEVDHVRIERKSERDDPAR